MKDQPASPRTTRRALIRLAVFTAIVGAAYGGSGLLRRLTEPALEFSPVPGLPGFRQVTGGPVSGGANAMIGIGAGKAERQDPDAGPTGVALCDALFGPDADPSRVQIAYFSDARCVYCRQVSPMLANMAKGDGVQVTWHDLPLLGQISTIAARASVAAREQGAYDVFHHRLMGTPAVPTPPYLRQLAKEAGIDPVRLWQDMRSEKTAQHLATSAAIARRFGFIGTPALVVGRTAVLGGVDQRLVDRLVAAAQKTGHQEGC